MPLINCKIKLKLKWTNHCVLSLLATENSNVNSDSTIFIIKDTKLYVSIVVLSVKNNQKLSKILAKDLRDQFIGMNIKSENKNRTNEY